MELREEVEDLLQRYVDIVDSDDLEAWPQLFTEDAMYRVLSRENLALGLNAPLIYYYSQGMLQDRVTALRDALTYEFVYTRHVTSPARFKRDENSGDLLVNSTFSIYQTTERGETRTFAVGAYQDVLAGTGHGLRFKRRDVILDSFGVPNAIAAPL